MKVWDFQDTFVCTQVLSYYCFYCGCCEQTLVGSRCELWSLVFLSSLGLLVSGSSDQELRGYRWDETSGAVVVGESQGLTAAGELSRPVGGGRCLSLRNSDKLLAVHSAKRVEVSCFNNNNNNCLL